MQRGLHNMALVAFGVPQNNFCSLVNQAENENEFSGF
jgi:hypothetical protein